MKSIVIRSGSVRVRIFTSRSGKYVRHEIRWLDHHRQPHRLKRSNKAEAIREARRIADDLARGHHHAELSLADLASFRLARQHLYGTGKTIEQACAEWAETQKLLKSSALSPLPSHPDLARSYLQHRPAAATPATETASATVEAFLLASKARGFSQRHQEDLRARLRKFAADNPCPTISVTAAQVQAWFLGFNLAPRTRNNYLTAVQTLFADGALAHHPHGPAIRLIRPCELAPIRKEIWTPAEMRRLLDTAARFDPALVPVLVLGAFAKLRTSEIAAHALGHHLRLDDGQMVLPDGGKTGGRLLPLPPNACAWLTRHAPKDGPIWTLSEDSLHRRLRALATRCAVKWRSNALRKSAQTYALLLDPDYDRISREAGNSPKMLRKYYVDPRLATKATAEEWFAIAPAMDERVIVPMPSNA